PPHGQIDCKGCRGRRSFFEGFEGTPRCKKLLKPLWLHAFPTSTAPVRASVLLTDTLFCVRRIPWGTPGPDPGPRPCWDSRFLPVHFGRIGETLWFCPDPANFLSVPRLFPPAGQRILFRHYFPMPLLSPVPGLGLRFAPGIMQGTPGAEWILKGFAWYRFLFPELCQISHTTPACRLASTGWQ